MIKIVRRENISVWIAGLGEARECVSVCVCVCLCIFVFVCIVFVSRGKHSRETPVVVMPAVTLRYSGLRL